VHQPEHKCSENDARYKNKHSVSVIKPSQLMLYGEIIAVCSEIHTKHINTLCGQNVELLNVKPGGTYSNQCSLIKSDMIFVITVSDNKN
jgi:hypothetical protein